MRHISMVLAALCVSACANGLAPDNAMSNTDLAALQQAQIDYDHCLRDAARKLDDGKSNVGDIALGVMASCTNQWSVALSLQTSGMDTLSRELYRERVKSQPQQSAAAAVLLERQSRHP